MLFTIMLISGILFIGSVLLMTPKGGLGFGVGGMSTSNEYGSKKSVEGTLKRTAVVSIVVFTITAMIYPYYNRKNSNLSNVKVNTKLDNSNVKTNNIKIENNSKKEDNSTKLQSINYKGKDGKDYTIMLLSDGKAYYVDQNGTQHSFDNIEKTKAYIDSLSDNAVLQEYIAPNGKKYMLSIKDSKVSYIGQDGAKHSFGSMEKAKAYIDARNQKGAEAIIHIAPNGKKYTLFKKDGKIYFVNIYNKNQYFDNIEKAKSYIDVRNQK